MKSLLPLVCIVFLLAAPSLFAQQPIMLGGQLGIGLPMGDFSDNLSTGIGVQGTILYQLQPKLNLVGHLGYTRFGYKTSSTVASGSYSVIPIVAGARYDLGEDNFKPYVQGEIGLYFASWTTSITTPFGNNEYSDSENNFGIAPSVGFTLPLKPNLFLDVNLKYTMIFTDVVSTEYLGLNAGIVLPLQ
jgi:hypothetical protein